MKLIKDTKNRTKMLAYLAQAATADSEADVNDFLRIFTPLPTRDEMGKVFETNLGYNPITHYDMVDVIMILDTIISDMNMDGKVKAQIEGKKDSIAKAAFNIYQGNRLANIKSAVNLALDEFMDNEGIDRTDKPQVDDEDDDFDPFEDEDDEEEDERIKLDDSSIDLNNPTIPNMDLGNWDELNELDDSSLFKDDEEDF